VVFECAIVHALTALFRGLEHQDAQEFLNYLLNACSDALDKEAKEAHAARGGEAASAASADSGAALVPAAAASTSFIKGLFEGVLANETKYVLYESVCGLQMRAGAGEFNVFWFALV
jgi:hypothetical protein